ncbi:putative lipopolysaccharide biosynthesis O-acetyl transferase WbbJ [Vibrio crassostreae]|nr:putative lipopolysaccharide biosynthesis O-acetyl transferase WbbJ [Vibrio crassostreae]CAK2951899.1 putative lipopolysaccharide biosynthesis O-acetyl transferase WbbJ [Vibrio crassostreae]CAK2952972.1 putative lipopolysaccharide biosynthesis O-acetyl transferase WbbJ [Vibrio crassostreae]CAK2953504.1 putative lipopolysaccharide biosynthesis O-acetyl transferase WbbJ [Vibrio crassostreae]CAK2955389.1 putative lipopolysaccharide biosynthesis O-acetyl transferase WbbJ [Vibrio crassostreae]
MRGYNLYSLFNIFISLIYSRLFHRKAKLIRLPVSIRGGEFIEFSTGFVSGRYCRIDAFGVSPNQIVFGNNCQINDGVHIAAVNHISFGNNVMIASRVFITDHQHGIYKGMDQSQATETVSERVISGDSVVVGDNVWIGEGVCILPGVKIGNNAIIGANSVVTRNIIENTIVCGNPAKTIKVFCDTSKSWINYS